MWFLPRLSSSYAADILDEQQTSPRDDHRGVMGSRGPGGNEDSVAFPEGDDLPSDVDVESPGLNPPDVALFARIREGICGQELDDADLSRALSVELEARAG